MIQYYELYPDEFKDLPEILLPMLNKDCIIDRDIAILKVCVDDGYIRSEDLEELSRNIIIFFEGLLLKLTNDIEGYAKDKSLNIIMDFIKNNLHYYNLRAKNLISTFSEL
jgi:hypothetical protein